MVRFTVLQGTPIVSGLTTFKVNDPRTQSKVIGVVREDVHSNTELFLPLIGASAKNNFPLGTDVNSLFIPRWLKLQRCGNVDSTSVCQWVVRVDRFSLLKQSGYYAGFFIQGFLVSWFFGLITSIEIRVGLKKTAVIRL